jgi:hypothetical protein
MLETAASIAVLGLFVAYLGSLPSIAPQQSAAARFAWMGEGDTEYYDSSYYAEPEGGYYSSEPVYGGMEEPIFQDDGYGIGGDTSFEPVWTPTSEPSDAFWNANQEPQGEYGDMGQWYTGTEYDNNYGYGNTNPGAYDVEVPESPYALDPQFIPEEYRPLDQTNNDAGQYFTREVTPHDEAEAEGWNRAGKGDLWDLHEGEDADAPWYYSIGCTYFGTGCQEDNYGGGYTIEEVYEYDQAPRSAWSIEYGYGVPTQYVTRTTGGGTVYTSGGYTVTSGSAPTVTTTQPPTTNTDVPSCTIDVSPNEISGEEAATLMWQADNAQTVFNEEGKRVSSNGITAVRPTESKVYTLTVNGANGRVARCSASLRVIPQVPQCTITARPSTIARGDSTLLEWNASGNVKAAISTLGDVVKEGSQTVYPDRKTRYELRTLDNKGQTRSCFVEVNVSTSTPNEGSLSLVEWLATMDTGKTTEIVNTPTISTTTSKTCQILSNVSSVAPNGSAFIQWALPQGYSGVITDIGPVNGVGYRSVTVPSTRTYTLMANGPQGIVNCATTITVAAKEVAPTCSLSVSKSSVNGPDDTVTLSWTSTNAVSAELYKFGSVNTSGSRSVIPTYSRTYTLAVKSKTGEMAACSAAVTVGSSGGGTSKPTVSAPTCSITVSPETVPAGGTVTVSWDARNATKATLSGGVGSVAMKSSKTFNPTQSTTYTVSVEDAAGKKSSCSKTVNVSQTESCAIVCGNQYTCVPATVAQQCVTTATAPQATTPTTPAASTGGSSNTTGGGFFSKLKFW